MRPIDRLIKYLREKRITAYSFEKTCQVANGYLKKQEKGKGTVGSDIVERIFRNYPELSVVWMITGQGKMIHEGSDDELTRNVMEEDKPAYPSDEIITELRERIKVLERLVNDKEKIIQLLEARFVKQKK